LLKSIGNARRVCGYNLYAIGNRLAEASIARCNKKENDQVECPQAGKLVRKNIAVSRVFTNVL